MYENSAAMRRCFFQSSKLVLERKAAARRGLAEQALRCLPGRTFRCRPHPRLLDRFHRRWASALRYSAAIRAIRAEIVASSGRSGWLCRRDSWPPFLLVSSDGRRTATPAFSNPGANRPRIQRRQSRSRRSRGSAWGAARCQCRVADKSGYSDRARFAAQRQSSQIDFPDRVQRACFQPSCFPFSVRVHAPPCDQ